MSFATPGAARPRTSDIIDRLAAEHKVQAAAVEAVIAVESAGKPYGNDGRLTILPERHKVYALLPAAKRAQAVKLGLARAKRSKSQYADMKSQDARWEFLGRVAEFADDETACRAASWGGPQIMGFNHRMCGFDSAVAMVRAFADSEDEQIRAMMAFIAAAGLMDELRALDWAGFARGYNGAGYASNAYDTKLAKAFAASQRKRLPSVKPAWREKAEADEEPILKLGSVGAEVKTLQTKLNGLALGISIAADGDFGPATKRAVIAFQAGRGLKADGMVGPATRAALEAAVPADPRPVSRADVVAESPAAQRSVAGAVLGGGAAVATGVRVAADVVSGAPDAISNLASLQNVNDVTSAIESISRTMDPLERILAFVEAHPVLLISVAVAVVCWLGFERIVAATKARNGVGV